MISLNGLKRTLDSKNNFILLGHIEPDGDCIGSLFALKWHLDKKEKKSIILLEEDLRDEYSFLPINDDDYLLFDDFSADSTFDEKIFIALDSGDLERLGKGKELIGDSLLINIDHHIDNPEYGNLNYIKANAAATGEILYDLFNIEEQVLDIRVGSALATALIADTGAFRYQNTTSRVLKIMAKLIDSGVDVYQINKGLFGSYSYQSIKLKGLVLATLEISKNGLISWLKVDRNVLRKTGSELKDTSGLVNYARDIKGVEVGIAFFEVDETTTRVGFRSNSYCPVNKIAAFFGGGGHPRAAGCTISLPIDQAIKIVINKVKEYLNDE